jgi:hypothetical protein
MVIAPRAREASVQISLQFDRSRTVDSAAQDVRAAIKFNGRPANPPRPEKSGAKDRPRVPASIVVVERESYFESDLVMRYLAVFDMAARF